MSIAKPVHRTHHPNHHQKREVVSGVHRRRPEPPATAARAERSGGKILFVTTEMTDFVKAGGLGDVSAALPPPA